MGIRVQEHQIAMDGGQLGDLGEPKSANEAATKGYVDAAIAAALASLAPPEPAEADEPKAKKK